MRAITTTSVMSPLITIDMDYQKVLKQALAVHQELLQNVEAKPEIVDLQLEARAREIHNFFYTKAPWHWFHRYVREVHDTLQRPYWLCSRPGVNEALLREIENERISN
jgi:hypothetical protein